MIQFLIMLVLLQAQAVGPYWCPMHPHIRGQKGELCPICHMALVPASTDYTPYRVDLATIPRAPRAGQPVRIQLTLRTPQVNAVLKDLETMHERVLHLFILSQDLAYFAHVHPERKRDGSFEQITTLPRPGAYRLVADFLPAGGAPQLLQQTVVTAGYTGPLVPDAQLAPDGLVKVVDGIRVKVSMPSPIAGREQLITCEFEDAASGQPISDLEPYLGAVGHMLLASADLETVAHSHPVADLSAGLGPAVVFQALFPRPGAYRFWVQFQRHGRVLVAPFTVVASPRESADAR